MFILPAVSELALCCYTIVSCPPAITATAAGNSGWSFLQVRPALNTPGLTAGCLAENIKLYTDVKYLTTSFRFLWAAEALRVPPDIVVRVVTTPDKLFRRVVSVILEAENGNIFCLLLLLQILNHFP